MRVAEREEKMISPKVSVVIITYNHEAYIEQAVKSVFIQETDFPIEILISEDCSTDATRRILLELRERWPQRIQLILSERNQFDGEVLSRCFPVARGEYVALLEGDDFWISSRKLQEQADFLDAHPECVSCFHPVKSVYEEGISKEPDSRFHPKARSSLKDLLVHGCFIETASVMFRRQAALNIPVWYRDVFCGDWVLHVLLARHGKIGYMDKAMAAHRYHAGGIWTRLGSVGRIEKTIEAYSAVQRHFGSEVQPLRRELARLWYGLAVERMTQGQVMEAMLCAKEGLRQKRCNLKLLVLRFAPGLWGRLRGLAALVRC